MAAVHLHENGILPRSMFRMDCWTTGKKKWKKITESCVRVWWPTDTLCSIPVFRASGYARINHNTRPLKRWINSLFCMLDKIMIFVANCRTQSTYSTGRECGQNHFIWNVSNIVEHLRLNTYTFNTVHNFIWYFLFLNTRIRGFSYEHTIVL